MMKMMICLVWKSRNVERERGARERNKRLLLVFILS